MEKNRIFCYLISQGGHDVGSMFFVISNRVKTAWDGWWDCRMDFNNPIQLSEGTNQ